MLKSFASAAAACVAIAVLPANAQIDLDVGADVDLGTEIRVGEPYTYDGHRSGRWYAYGEPERAQVYYDQYGGYDCYRAFRYTWEDGHRARYDAYWCYDEAGRKYEVDGTRASVRID